jgi:hypothetical protein
MTPAQRAEHAALFEPAASPDDYKIHVGQPLDEAGQEELSSTRVWLHAAGVPVKDGELIAEVALKDGRALAAMNPEQRENYKQRESAKLQRLWKGDYSDHLAGAQRLVREVEAKHPGALAWLEKTGLGNSYALIAQLGEIAQRKYGKTR